MQKSKTRAQAMQAHKGEGVYHVQTIQLVRADKVQNECVATFPTECGGCGGDLC